MLHRILQAATCDSKAKINSNFRSTSPRRESMDRAGGKTEWSEQKTVRSSAPFEHAWMTRNRQQMVGQCARNAVNRMAHDKIKAQDFTRAIIKLL